MTDQELLTHQHYLIKVLVLKLGCETTITKEEYVRAIGMRLEMRVWEETTSMYLMETNHDHTHENSQTRDQRQDI